MMRALFIILMILATIAIVAVAVLNSEIVTVNYLFGQIALNLFAVILGSALVGVVIMFFFMIYRSIHNYVKAESTRNLTRELQNRVKSLESENKKLEEELSKLQLEKELTAEQARVELEAEKKKLEEELNRQQKERDETAAREQAELEKEKNKLEEELKKQLKNHEHTETGQTVFPPKKKGFFDFLKK